MDFGGLELKLHEVHFAVKFSEALDCQVHRVQFQPNVNKETAKYVYFFISK